MLFAAFCPLVASNVRRLSVSGTLSLQSYRDPIDYSHVIFPLWEKRKLPLLAKVPQLTLGVKPRKMTKRLSDMRGPEMVHNTLLHKQYGIQATMGGSLTYGHLESARLNINRKMDANRMFAIWRVDAPWKPITKKGLGVRMGGGKGAIHHYVTPVKANRIILEMGGMMELEEVMHILKVVAHNLPFPARVVTHQQLEEEREEQKRIADFNLNPFSFEHAVLNNFFGVQKCLSKYDYIWHNKYR